VNLADNGKTPAPVQGQVLKWIPAILELAKRYGSKPIRMGYVRSPADAVRMLVLGLELQSLDREWTGTANS